MVFRIHKYQQSLGVGQIPTFEGELPPDFPSREAAKTEIDRRISGYDINGYDEKQDYWWCRNKVDKENLILVIATNAKTPPR